MTDAYRHDRVHGYAQLRDGGSWHRVRFGYAICGLGLGPLGDAVEQLPPGAQLCGRCARSQGARDRLAELVRRARQERRSRDQDGRQQGASAILRHRFEARDGGRTNDGRCALLPGSLRRLQPGERLVLLYVTDDDARQLLGE